VYLFLPGNFYPGVPYSASLARLALPVPGPVTSVLTNPPCISAMWEMERICGKRESSRGKGGEDGDAIVRKRLLVPAAGPDR